MSSNLKRSTHMAALAMLRYLPRTRLKARKVYWGWRRRQYDALAERTPTQPNTVMFESYLGRSYACSPRAVYECLRDDARYQGFELIWAFRRDEIDTYRHALESEGATVVERGTDAYFEALARAKYWIFNNRVAEYVTPKDDQVYVQCWHGTPLKRLGYDVEIETQNALNTTSELADRFGLDAEKWTYLVSPSPYASQHLCDAFGVPQERRDDVVLEIGYPRNDRIVNSCRDAATLSTIKSRIMKDLGINEGKKLLLYAPTWRDSDYKAGVGYVQDALIDFDVLQREIGQDWVVLFRPHYYIANSFDFSKYGDFVVNAADVSDINDLYIIADALLTDYSSVFFDYACTGRPLLFFMPDLEHYADDIRGFYFDPMELPGPHCETTEEVARAVQEIDRYHTDYETSYRSFRQRFCPNEDGHAAQRLAAIIDPLAP